MLASPDEILNIQQSAAARNSNSYKWPPRCPVEGLYLYAFELLNDEIYIGSTNNIINRLVAHYTGEGSKATKHHGIKNLIYLFRLNDKTTIAEMLEMEQEIKLSKPKLHDFNGTTPIATIYAAIYEVQQEINERILIGYPPFNGKINRNLASLLTTRRL